MKQAVLIVGATSAIARAVAQQLAQEKHNLILAARDFEELERIAADLRVRWQVEVAVVPFDATAVVVRPTLWERSIQIAGDNLHGIVVAQGFMASQADAQRDSEIARRVIEINYASPVAILNEAANFFEQRRRGFICAISSVAGDRGRQSNYLYGSAKAGLNTFLQGLRNRLAKSGVAVITIKPGFVDTAMTWGLPGMFLVAKPQEVARDICRAIRRRRSTVYTPWFWRIIMTLIRAIPEPVFKRMKL